MAINKFLFLIFVLMIVSATLVSASKIHEYTFENGGIDTLGTANGTLGTVVAGPGINGTAYYFDGNYTSYINLNFLGYTVFNGGSSNFTVTMWIYPTSTTNSGLLGNLISNNYGTGINVWPTENRFSIYNHRTPSAPIVIYSSSDLVLNEWNYIAYRHTPASPTYQSYLSINGNHGPATNSYAWLENAGAYTCVGKQYHPGVNIATFVGGIDEVRVYDSFLSTEELDYEYALYTAATPDLTIVSPSVYSRNNVPLDVSYYLEDEDNLTLSCDLYVDDILDASNSSVDNNTVTSLSSSMSPGIHIWSLNCTDGENTVTSGDYYYDYDNSTPFINVTSPLSFNNTVFSNNTMSIVGDISDSSGLFRVNVTIFRPNGTVFWNNYSGDLDNTTTDYSWNEVFDTTDEQNGDWSMLIEATDPEQISDLGGLNPSTLEISFEVNNLEDVIIVDGRSGGGGNFPEEEEIIIPEQIIPISAPTFSLFGDLNLSEVPVWTWAAVAVVFALILMNSGKKPRRKRR